MKTLFRHVFSAMRSLNKRDPDVQAAAPLVHLLDEAEPAPDMFAQIEARIDNARQPRTVATNLFVVLAFICGLAVGGSVLYLGQDRQRIVARPAPDASWVPLGSVTLQGAGLRGFVRAKCRGHTHFFITMHGHTPPDRDSGTALAVPLMESGEKILMECIF